MWNIKEEEKVWLHHPVTRSVQRWVQNDPRFDICAINLIQVFDPKRHRWKQQQNHKASLVWMQNFDSNSFSKNIPVKTTKQDTKLFLIGLQKFDLRLFSKRYRKHLNVGIAQSTLHIIWRGGNLDNDHIIPDILNPMTNEGWSESVGQRWSRLINRLNNKIPKYPLFGSRILTHDG